MIGGEAWSKRGILTLKYPVEHGVVVNWDDAEKLMQHIFYNELRIAPEENFIIFPVPPHTPKANREKVLQILMESFNIPAVAMVSEAVLIAHASGLENALVVSSGDGVTWACPVINGRAIESAAKRADFGGKDVTDYLVTLYSARGKDLTSKSDRLLVDGLKIEFGFVSQNYARDLKSVSSDPKPFSKSPEMPDGSIFSFDKERFMAPEVIFNQSLLDAEVFGKLRTDTAVAGVERVAIQHLCLNAIEAVEKASHRDRLWSSVVIAGGNTLFPGFDRRLESELRTLAPVRYSKAIRVRAPLSRIHSNFIGASKLGGQWQKSFDNATLSAAFSSLLFASPTENIVSVSEFRPFAADSTPPIKKFILLEEYNELGPSIVEQKQL